MFVLHGVRGQGGMGVRRPRTSTKWTSFFAGAIYEIRLTGPLGLVVVVFSCERPLFLLSWALRVDFTAAQGAPTDLAPSFSALCGSLSLSWGGKTHRGFHLPSLRLVFRGLQ